MARKVSNTLRFYTNKLPYKAKQFNRYFPLEPYFKEMIGDKKEVHIADLGAGMFSTTGSYMEGIEVHLTPSDMLADEYSELLEKAGVKRLIPVEKQDMLHLTYQDETFDIVHCVNALDHCNDPILAIAQMYRVCKTGGWIYLRHFTNVAEGQRYRGEHKWNIQKVGNDCKIWNKEEVVMISSMFKYFKVFNEMHDNHKGGEEEVVILMIRK